MDDAQWVRAFLGTSQFVRHNLDLDQLTVVEVGDGNLNEVYLCRDAGGRGLCLKRSLPYVRLVGDSWPLTEERIAVEARWYQVVSELAPELAAGFQGYDPEAHVLALEDLSAWRVWRSELCDGVVRVAPAAAMGVLVAETAWSTSWFAVGGPEHRRRAAAFVNPELCQITEDLVFTEPWLEHHPHNSVPPGLLPVVAGLRSDPAVRARVAALHEAFVTRTDVLIHGDLHTGSVMVAPARGPGSAKAIDGEFSCYGPVGLDLGMLAANQLFAEVRAVVLGAPTSTQAELHRLRMATWSAFEKTIRAHWSDRLDQTLEESMLQSWLQRCAWESVGYAGCEAVRRVVGLAKVPDLTTLDDDAHHQACQLTLTVARRWMQGSPKGRSGTTEPGDVWRFGNLIVADVLDDWRQRSTPLPSSAAASAPG